MFLVKPMSGLINSDYQVVVVQLLKTRNKESLYAERWGIVFDGLDDNSVITIIIHQSFSIIVFKILTLDQFGSLRQCRIWMRCNREKKPCTRIKRCTSWVSNKFGDTNR